MDALLSQTIVQGVGAVIVTLALIQAVLMLYSAWRGVGHSRTQSALTLELLRKRVEGATAHQQSEQNRATLSWTGVRKFRVQRKVDEGGDVCSFYLVPHDGKPLAPFQPGTYLTFQLRIPNRPKPLIRCYSLSESQYKQDFYRVSIKRVPPPRDQPDVPPGLSSSFFHDQVNEDDILDVKAPNGQFFLDMSQSTPVVLIGGGIGVTPVLSMLNAICDSGSTRETWFFFGVRNSRDHIMKEHLQQIANEHENVHLRVCYSNPLDGDTPGRDHHHDERISVELLQRVLPSNNYDFFLCGPPPMMNGLVPDLEAWGVPRQNIHFEAFGPATVKKAASAHPAEATPSDEPIDVTFAKSGKTCIWDGTADSLLDFAENNGVSIDSGCRAGNCGTCITAVKEGEAIYLSEPGSPPEEGSCLTCISVPKTNMVLDA